MSRAETRHLSPGRVGTGVEACSESPGGNLERAQSQRPSCLSYTSALLVLAVIGIPGCLAVAMEDYEWDFEGNYHFKAEARTCSPTVAAEPN